MPLRTAVFSSPTALTLGAATSDRINCGGAADITGVARFSGAIYCRLTTLTSLRQIASKSDAGGSRGWFVELTGTTGNFEISVVGTVGLLYATNNTPLTLNKWQFVGWTCDTALGAGAKAHFYASTSPSSDMIECTVAAPTEGSGYVVDTTADPYLWGNDLSLAEALQGQVAFGWFAPNVVWTLDQFHAWQRNPLKVLPSMKLFTAFDREAGLLIDRTGLGHHGTVT